MPKHEIGKHTKAIYTELNNPHKSWKHKLGEVLIKIAIIVFAITLSLLLERWREDAHDRTIEKKFLIGLRQDLQTDLKQLTEDSISYHNLLKSWIYMRNAGLNNQPLNNDTLKKYGETLLSGTNFIPNDSRFEALKSSGEFNVIENDSLQNLILDLYQNRIKSLQLSASYFSRFKSEDLFHFLFKNLQVNKDGTSNLSALVQMPEMQNYLMLGSFSFEIMERYHNVILQSRQIIKMIDEQYH